MIVIRQYRIYRKDIRVNPDCVYVFGDNLERRGFGGQAREMRHEPNSFGIATKRRMTRNYPDDYFFDSDRDTITVIEKDFLTLFDFIKRSQPKAVILPLDGIGTGIAKLKENAPVALQYIEYMFKQLEEKL